MLEIILKELDNLGCVPRIDTERGLMISNASRIDRTLGDAIREHRDSIVEFLTKGSENVAQDASEDITEVDPVDCDKCGGLCTVERFYTWACPECDDLEASAALTRKWMIYRKTILKRQEIL